MIIRKFLFISMIVVFATTAYAQKKQIINIYESPRTLPQYNLYTETGKSLKLSDFKGKFIIAIFWSKKCSVCIKELDDVNEFSKIVKDNGIEVLLISPSDEWNNILETRNFMNKYGAKDMIVYWDDKGSIASSLGIFTTPHNVLINDKGLEIGRIRGGADWDSETVIEYIYKIKAQIK